MFETMRRHLKNYLIPHEGNEHKPHILREVSILALTLVVVLVFGFSVFQAVLVRTNEEFLAAVVPAVLTDLANEDRAEAGLSSLTTNPVLAEAARMKAEDMAEHEYFAHVSPQGLEPWYWFYRAGYTFTKAGENLAVDFTDSHDVNEAWMDSPGHRANIMNGAFTEIGIAAVSGTFEGRKTIFVVQMFGTPALAAAEASPVSIQIESEFIREATTETEEEPTVAGESIVVTEPEPTVEEEPVIEPVVVAVLEPAPALTDMYAEDRTQAPAPAVAPVEKVNEASALDEVLARPRAVVEWVYLMIGLMLALAMLLMVYRRVHIEHSRNMLYGVALLAIICLLFYFNYLLLSADLLVV